MITADLDRELAGSVRSLITRGGLPGDAAVPAAAAAAAAPAGTWRRAPDGRPGAYSTSVPQELAALAGRPAADVAASLAERLRVPEWIEAVVAAGGYLTIIVTPQALAASAGRMAAAGSACASSAILSGTAAVTPPWPHLAAAAGWHSAWQDQATATTGQLAGAAGAAVQALSAPALSAPALPDRERGPNPPGQPDAARSPVASAPVATAPVAAAVEYAGADAVRYWLARTAPGAALPPAGLALPPAPDYWPGPRPGEPLDRVRHAHAEAAATGRWAADLRLVRAEGTDSLGRMLAAPAERELLTVLSFLPVRVAAAARRKRPDDLPRYLEEVGVAWLACRQEAPALPFGGDGAPASAAVTGARLVLADAVRAVLAAGLGLTGVSAEAAAPRP